MARRTARRTSRRVAGRQEQQAAPQEPEEQPAPEEAAPQPAPAPGELSQDALAELKQLGELHDSGVLTNEEFAQQKAKILGT